MRSIDPFLYNLLLPESSESNCHFIPCVTDFFSMSSLVVVGSTYGPSKIAKPTVFQVVLRGIGKSFQSAITAPRINLTGYSNATAQS